jgi:DinB superfamily
LLSQSVWSRLSGQLDSVATVLADAPERAITARGTEGAWSTHEHIAHLGRMHEVMIDRLRRILRENGPRLSEYRSEADAEWPTWAALPTREALTRLQALRSELLDVVRSLSDAQLRRTATHPTLGPLSVAGWLEAFCLHEGHHLHVAWGRLAEAKRTARVTPTRT